jgi:hypothetical protein
MILYILYVYTLGNGFICGFCGTPFVCGPDSIYQAGGVK